MLLMTTVVSDSMQMTVPFLGPIQMAAMVPPESFVGGAEKGATENHNLGHQIKKPEQKFSFP